MKSLRTSMTSSNRRSRTKPPGIFPGTLSKSNDPDQEGHRRWTLRRLASNGEEPSQEDRQVRGTADLPGWVPLCLGLSLPYCCWTQRTYLGLRLCGCVNRFWRGFYHPKGETTNGVIIDWSSLRSSRNKSKKITWPTEIVRIDVNGLILPVS